MSSTPEDLRALLDATLAHYNARADAFWEATRDHDVRQNREALLAALGPGGPWTILDLGCGPGRDLRAFSEQGHRVIGIDGASRFVDMAASFSGCEVWHQDFLQLDLPALFFDGIFANASLFHVPRQALPCVLSQLRAALKPTGVLLSSNPRGDNEESYRDGRYGVFYDWPSWKYLLCGAGFVEVTHYYRPADVAPEQQRWIASVWRKE